jgi:hypothetical protein
MSQTSQRDRVRVSPVHRLGVGTSYCDRETLVVPLSGMPAAPNPLLMLGGSVAAAPPVTAASQQAGARNGAAKRLRRFTLMPIVPARHSSDVTVGERNP